MIQAIKKKLVKFYLLATPGGRTDRKQSRNRQAALC